MFPKPYGLFAWVLITWTVKSPPPIFPRVLLTVPCQASEEIQKKFNKSGISWLSGSFLYRKLI